MSLNSIYIGVPNSVNQTANFADLKNLNERMKQSIIDQPEAVDYIAQMIQLVKTGLADDSKPRVLFFAGPTGVGKTELAKLTAHELKIPLHRFDMSEFSEAHKVSRLLGSPPGYINSAQGGDLTNKLKKTPSCVVLFDEIEKAHSDIFKIFLQLFDEGRITDSMGQEVIATQSIFILTSNLGSSQIYLQMKKKPRRNLDERLKALYEKSLIPLYTTTLSPELYSRFEKVIFFRPLSRASIEKIVQKFLIALKNNLAQKTLEMTWDQEVIEYFSTQNVDINMGARGINKKINQCIRPLLASSRMDEKILQTNVKVHLKVISNQLQLIVLDKGKPGIPSQEPIKDETNPKEAITLKDGIVYLDFITKRPLKEFEGKYVYRAFSNGSDRSFMNECIKIIEITSTGDILYEYEDSLRGPHHLSSTWNNNEWKLVTPTMNGRAFFKNICTLIDSPSFREDSLTYVKLIFDGLGEKCHLSEREPFVSLKEQCIKKNKKDLLEYVDALENRLGSFSVRVLSEEPLARL